jgi:imidazolonepropionase-like amidohydrolase
MGNIALVRQAFSNARDYLNRWGEYHEKVRKDPAKAGLAPARDLRLEAIGSVLTGETLAQVHCYRADDMDDMLQVSDEFGFKIRAFHHAVEAYKIRDVLAKRGIGVATWHHWWGFKLEAWDAIPENASLLSRAGVPVAIHSDSSLGTQHLPQNAGYALGAGRAVGVDVSDDEAIRWVTLNPAWILGVDRLTGSLEVGKAADVVVWDRSPMSSVARAERVYADGVLTFDLAHGPQFISDFEVEQPPLLTARPAPLLEGLAVPATCDPRRGPCPGLVTLDVTATCTAIQHVTALVDGVARADVTVVLKGGKVAALDAKAEPPAGCRRVDGVGRVLAPGFIDPYSVLGLAEVDQEESTSELSPRGDAARPTIRAAGAAADNVNATSAHLPTARRAGITGALIGPRHNGLVWGQGAFLALDGTVPRRAVAMYASLSQTARDSTGLPRGQLEATLRDALADARLYAAKKADYDANRLRPLAASRADLEALQKVLKGELPLVIEAHRALDIRAAIDLGQVEKLKVIIAGAEEGHLVAAELARAKVPVIIRPLNDLPYNYESLASRPDNAALLTKAGVTVLLSTMGMPGEEVQLPQEAALAVSWGLPEADALGGLTGKVADVFGLDTGHLAVGKRADVVLWSGDPIESSSTPLGIWIGGTQVTLESHASALREKYWVPGRR